MMEPMKISEGTMKMLATSHQVWTDGCKGVFIVATVDQTHGVADLQLTTNPRFILKDVPFGEIHSVVKGDVIQEAIRAGFARTPVPSIFARCADQKEGLCSSSIRSSRPLKGHGLESATESTV
jgi:hypothetical protein